MKYSSFFSSIILGGLTLASAHADDMYNSLSGTPEGGFGFGGNTDLFDSFTATTSGPITGLVLSLDYVGSPGLITGSIDIYLFSGSSPSNPSFPGTGEDLGTISRSEVSSGGYSDYSVLLTTNATFPIVAGTRYWVGVTDVATRVSDIAWENVFSSGTGVAGEYSAYTANSSVPADAQIFANSTSAPFAMEVIGPSVPDQAPTPLLLVLSTASLALVARKSPFSRGLKEF